MDDQISIQKLKTHIKTETADKFIPKVIWLKSEIHEMRLFARDHLIPGKQPHRFILYILSYPKSASGAARSSGVQDKEPTLRSAPYL